jgi:hypothetical protein
VQISRELGFMESLGTKKERKRELNNEDLFTVFFFLGESMIKCATKSTCQSTCQMNKK